MAHMRLVFQDMRRLRTMRKTKHALSEDLSTISEPQTFLVRYPWSWLHKGKEIQSWVSITRLLNIYDESCPVDGLHTRASIETSCNQTQIIAAA